MAEGDSTNNDAADAGTAGGGGIDDGGASRPTSSEEAAGGDPANFDASGVGARQQEDGGEGGAERTRPGNWNPGERSGGGSEVY
jgi:hypothetical protein